MFITNESMQVLKAGKATVSGSYKVGQVVTFKCDDGSTQKAKCTHAYQLNQYMSVGEFKPLPAMHEVLGYFNFYYGECGECGRETLICERLQ